MIRAAESRDVAWMSGQLELFAREYGTKRSLLPPRDEVEQRLDALIAEHIFLVAEVDGELTGFIGGLLMPHFLNPEILQLTEMFWWVAPEHRGGSIGIELLEDFLGAGQAAGAHWVTVSTLPGTKLPPGLMASLGLQLREMNYLLEID